MSRITRGSACLSGDRGAFVMVGGVAVGLWRIRRGSDVGTRLTPPTARP